MNKDNLVGLTFTNKSYRALFMERVFGVLKSNNYMKLKKLAAEKGKELKD